MRRSLAVSMLAVTAAAAILGAAPAGAAEAQVAADLTLTALSNPPSSVVLGASFTVTDTTSNVGGDTTPDTTTRYYLSSDTVRNSGDRLLVGGRPVPALPGGTSNTGSRSVKVPANVVVGSYYLVACADDLLVVAESSELNNCLASSTRVQVTGQASPDLSVTSLSNPPTSVILGNSFSVTDTTSNIGSGSAGSSTTRYYLSSDTARNTGDRLLVGGRDVAGLAAGSSNTGSRSVKIPLNVSQGLYYVLGCADDLLVITESVETNNCFSSSTRVNVSAALPDLYADAAYPYSSSVTAGASFTAYSHVHNQGQATAAASSLRFYVSFDSVRDSGDRQLSGLLSVPSLTPSGFFEGERSVTVPRNVASGSYYLLSCADDTVVVAESDETNNCNWGGYFLTVTPGTASAPARS